MQAVLPEWPAPPAAARVTARAVTTPLSVQRGGPAGGTVTVPWAGDLFPLQGHYPGFPIVPGVFLVETADRAVRAATDVRSSWSGIRTTRFRRPVFPGDLLHAHVTIAAGSAVTTAKVALDVDDEAVASVTLTYQDGAPDPLPDAAVGPATTAGDGDGSDVDVDVARILPHRYPMLLVDRVLQLSPARSLVAAKAVSAGEWPFAGGPTTAGYPWPLVVESWCQSAGVLAAHDRPNPDVRTGQVMLFGGISGIRFGAAARPGDVLVHRVRLERDLGDVLMMSGSSEVAGRTVMSVERISMAMKPAGDLTRPAKEG